MGPVRRYYLIVRRWVDAKLSSPRRRINDHAFWPAAVPLLPIIILQSTEVLAWAAAAAFSVAWVAFCSWRSYRLMRAGGLKSSRHYDRIGKYDLPAEYAGSESYLAHQKRGRAGQIDDPS